MYERNYHKQVINKVGPKEQDNKKLPSLIKIIFIIFIVSFVIGIFIIIKHPKLQIKNIEVLGNSVVDKEEVISLIKEQTIGKKAWLLPASSIVLINTESLEKILKDQFSRIEKVKIKRVNKDSLSVVIQEYNAEYLWCQTSDQSSCFFVDKNGLAYSVAPDFSGSAYPKIINSKISTDLPFKALEIYDIQKINILKSELSDIGIIATVFDFTNDQFIKVFFIHNKKLSHILINYNFDVQVSLEYIFSALRTESFALSFTNPEKFLEYLDVRFPNKIVYKFNPSTQSGE